MLKSKIRQLYRFLKEANQLQFRPIRTLIEQPESVRLEDLPKHPAIQVYRRITTAQVREIPDILLRIKRPTITKCPLPPEHIASWLIPGWDDPMQNTTYTESQNEINEQGETVTIAFHEDEQRLVDFESWQVLRNAWAIPEKLARTTLRFFEVFYDIHSTIEKDREQLELLIADGRLGWAAISANDGSVVIDHPVLLKRVELRFDPKIPEFTVHETDREAELYSGLFADLHEVDPLAIKNRKAELEMAGYHPFGWEDTEAFLKAFIQTISPINGEFLEEGEKNGISNIPKLWRDPVLILRKRVAGIANAIDAVLDDIEHREVFPPALAQITGTVDKWKDSGFTSSAEGTSGQSNVFSKIEDDDILLAKEANEEQLQIIRRLHASGSVVVQGPPGTGKTHTIANLIGHLLSHGKSILVTAQTAKALRVLRDKVPEMLQPLCVSVLGSDQDAKRQLETSIGLITEKLTTESTDSLLEKASKFELERKELLHRSRELKHKLREALENEYRPIYIGDQQFSPVDAARFVASYAEQHAWISSPVRLCSMINLSFEELVRLYALSTAFTHDEEQDARYPAPDLSILPSEQEFQAILSEYQHLLTQDISVGSAYWGEQHIGSKTIENMVSNLELEFSNDLRRQAWRPYAIIAGMHGTTERQVWEQLIATIEKTVEANAHYALVLSHQPRLSTTIPISKQLQISKEICEYLENGEKIGFIQLAIHSEWRQFIKAVSVAAGQPTHREHFLAIHCLIQLESYRLELEFPWNNLIGQYTDKQFNTLDPNPELACRILIPEIKRCLDWHASVWEPLKTKLIEEGFKFDRFVATLSHDISTISEYIFIEQLATEHLPSLLSAEAARQKLREYLIQLKKIEQLLIQTDPATSDRGCLGQTIMAVRSRNSENYSIALNYIRRLQNIRPLVVERDQLIDKLWLVAPGWAEQIRNRISPHHDGKLPGDVTVAWKWRQLHDSLIERDKLDASELQREIDKTRDILRKLTELFIEAKAWGKQLERLQNNHSIRQALVGWLDTAKRLDSVRQREKRQTLLSESRKLMKKCVDAVPVWIMPIGLMVESFDLRNTRFDVVIIDEASQADLNALIPLYMGSKIIVVGDHEQVTPLGVGKDQTILENLRKSMLEDMPNSHLFDHLASIYDIGRQSFGDTIRLVEHFRCVPEIIAFSNKLSYEGTIRPLRESNSTHIKPACVAYQVNGMREGDINKCEAQRIVLLIKAMTKHPAYIGKSIGVISMLKQNQAILIQSLIHKEIESVEIERRRIQAGLSSEFQGDERDIIFLSLVDSTTEQGTLRAMGEGAFESIKKRYNVAASRARDQLWVVHSFDPDLHLKMADIRFSLLQHVRDPLATLRSFNAEVSKTESPFEREVLKRLTDAGFRVKTQWQVGYYRIDMVVEGNEKRLAIECDGDKYHPMDKLAADMARQAVLERLGWQFVRIRGSVFYRDPFTAMKPIFERLAELDILPIANTGELQSPTNMTLIHELEALLSDFSI